jgi:hypothetical protein
VRTAEEQALRRAGWQARAEAGIRYLKAKLQEAVDYGERWHQARAEVRAGLRAPESLSLSEPEPPPPARAAVRPAAPCASIAWCAPA